MADKSFDAIIIGGGNKGLITGMYLTKYAGMSVGISIAGTSWGADGPARRALHRDLSPIPMR